MKLIVAVIQDRDANDLTRALTDAGHRHTKLSSTGGFLRSGNTTLIIGTEDANVEAILAIIHKTCQAREHLMQAISPAAATGEAFVPFPHMVTIGGATVFVVDVDRFEKW